jgi:hypothetical protein
MVPVPRFAEAPLSAESSAKVTERTSLIGPAPRPRARLAEIPADPLWARADTFERETLPPVVEVLLRLTRGWEAETSARFSTARLPELSAGAE